MKIKDKIVKALEEEGDLSVKELVDILHASKQGIHIALKQLLEENKIIKLGRTPKTIYKLNPELDTPSLDKILLTTENANYLKKNFLHISEVGKLLDGIDGFSYWCNQRKLPLEKTILEFIKTRKKYDTYFNHQGFINGQKKLHNTKGFTKINLDEIFYLEFYAIERFGKTRLGSLLHFAKQGQNKFLMSLLIAEIKQKINNFVANGNFDAVGFVPPTIRREVQIMKYLETHLKINLPRINIQKISGIIPVPQKSLNKIDERINNAENTFAVQESISYKHLLLIDDAIGSGATLNQIAGKIKQKKIAKTITGLAIVGSFKGFDVLTDV